VAFSVLFAIIMYVKGFLGLLVLFDFLFFVKELIRPSVKRWFSYSNVHLFKYASAGKTFVL
jgi:hypothetical protein